jgi:GxxExxY protein
VSICGFQLYFRINVSHKLKEDKEKYDLVYQVVGYALEVINELGHGLREKTYEKGLIVEFKNNSIRFSQQKIYSVYYKNVHIDDYIPDLLVNDELIVEIKVAEKICDEHIGQVINYLKISGCSLGLILNFKHPKLEWKRVILTENKSNRK